ncbi:MAG: cysteine--tRNA ligase [Chloroflexi bacterium]|nr:cysteine--tRNA ligase [Chloroflexota bacterium]
MKISSTLTGKKEEFAPADGKTVKMYVCGVTPYSAAHVGHAMSAMNFDMIRRYLEHKGYTVRYVQNFTDIDDKIIDRANRLGIPATELAERHIAEFFREMDALNIKRATVYPRATQELPKIIEVIQGLIAKGYAYVAGNNDVYFRVTKDDDYGKLSHRTLDSMVAGARVEPGVQKEHPMDFALWKAAKPGEPEWASPWGPGRPGWHIECSAMSLRHLGETLDIHGGGADLIFPHHENEIAQSESFTGKQPFARFWLHNGLLQLGEEKMSKSLGNLVTIKEALERHSADAMRLFVLGSHYRSPLKFSEESVQAADRGAERLRIAAGATSKGTGDPVDAAPFNKRFEEAMDDDFNTAQAIAALFDLAREINRGAEEARGIQKAQVTLRALAGVLGLTLKEAASHEAMDLTPLLALIDEVGEPPSAKPTALAQVMDHLIARRAALRKAKHFQLADRIRIRLGELGIALEDGPEGTKWRKAR